MKRILLSTMAVIGAVALALPAAARMDGPAGRRGGDASGVAVAPRAPQGGCGDSAELAARTAGAMAYARVRLGITDAQASAWQALETAVVASREPMERLCAGQSGAPAAGETLPARLARQEAAATARAEGLRAVRPAVEALYAQLAPEQRARADELLRHGIAGGPRQHEGLGHREAGPGATVSGPDGIPGEGLRGGMERRGGGAGNPVGHGPLGAPGDRAGPPEAGGAPQRAPR